MADTGIAQLTRLPAPPDHEGSWFVGPVHATREGNAAVISATYQGEEL